MFTADLKRGSMELLILSVLEREPRHRVFNALGRLTRIGPLAGEPGTRGTAP